MESLTVAERREKLQAEMGKKFGKNVLKKASEFPPVEFIKSGIPMLDYALTGGVPRGRVVELWGPRSGGKTSTAGLYVAGEQRYQLQQDDPRAQLWIDRENTFDPPWMTKLGVDCEFLDLIRDGEPDARGNPVFHTAEDVVNLTIQAAESGVYSMIVWDSLAAVTPKAKIEGKKEFADQRTPGALAALMSETLPHMVSVFSKFQCTLIIVNQYREKIAIQYGNPATRPGGNALEHYASQIIEVRQGDFYESAWIDQETGAELGKRRIGNDCRVKVIKNKCGPCWRDATTPFFYDRGVDMPLLIRDLSLDLRVVEARGRFIYHDAFLPDPETGEVYGEPINHEKGYVGSRDELAEALRRYPDILETLRLECEEKIQRV